MPSDNDMPEIAADDRAIIEEAAPYTMTGPQRRYAVVESTRYIVRRGIPGAFVECGVWRGGSVLAMIRTLQRMGVDDRDIWLYDTFEGMTEPTAEDRSPFQGSALTTWRAARAKAHTAWSQFFDPGVFNLADVRALLLATGYPEARLHFVKGAVEETIPASAPDSIALLRLDTDWYASTRHELRELYPRMSDGGVLIIDDYGHWEGCRKAVDEYFGSGDVPPVLLQRIDYTARLAIKG